MIELFKLIELNNMVDSLKIYLKFDGCTISKFKKCDK